MCRNFFYDATSGLLCGRLLFIAALTDVPLLCLFSKLHFRAASIQLLLPPPTTAALRAFLQKNAFYRVTLGCTLFTTGNVHIYRG